MKKMISMVTVVMMLLFTLTGCSKNTTETVTLEATVVSCEEGTYHTNSTYSSTATMHLANGDYAQYNMYNTLANATGYYDYDITVSIGDEFHTIVRDKTYALGSTIYVEKVMTYNEDNQLIKTTYR